MTRDDRGGDLARWDLVELFGRLESVDPEERAEARLQFGGVLTTIGLHEEALAAVDAAAAHFAAARNGVALAFCGRAAGTVLRALGDLEEAAERFRVAAARFRSHGMIGAAAEAQGCRGVLLLQMGQRGDAIASMRLAGDGYRQAGNATAACRAFAAAAEMAVNAGDPALGDALYAEAQEALETG